MSRTTIGMVAFADMQLLDFIAPYEFLSAVPEFDVTIVAREKTPLGSRVVVVPDSDFLHAQKFEVLFVPGGAGVSKAIEDDGTIDFLAERGNRACYVTSVCTGSLVLGVAGLLRGYRATTHWRYTEILAAVGAEYTEGRVVRDRNRITAGGVTAGLDFGLDLIAELAGPAAAETVQLALEYDPHAPPGGHPRTARHEIVDRIRTRTQASFDARAALVSAKMARPR